MVGRDEEQGAAVVEDPAGPAPGGVRLGDRARVGRAGREQVVATAASDRVGTLMRWLLGWRSWRRARRRWAWRRRRPGARRPAHRRRWRTPRSAPDPSRTAARGPARRRTRRRRRGRRRPRPGAAGTTVAPSAVATSTPSPPILTSASSTPRASSRVGRLVRVAGADRDLDLGPVADGDGHVVEHRVVLGPRLLRRGPEHLAPVEVEDGPATRAGLGTRAPGQHLELGGARRLDAHARCRSPTGPARRDTTSHGTSSSVSVRSGAIGAR